MKTGTIEIAGKTYITCLSTRVVMNLQKKGKLEDVLADVEKSEDLSTIMELIYMLIDAGDRYAKLAGLDNPPLMSFDDMVDVLGIDDLANMRDAFAMAVVDATPDIKTVAPNTPASQDEK